MRIKDSDIRKATISDASMLNFLVRQCFSDVARRFGITMETAPGHPSNSTVETVQKSISNGIFFFIKIDRGIPVGYMGLERTSESMCSIVHLGVLPGRRRRGFGTQLLEKAIMESKKAGANCIVSTILTDDTALRQWHENFGFFEIETRSEKYFPLNLTDLQLSL